MDSFTYFNVVFYFLLPVFLYFSVDINARYLVLIMEGFTW